MADQALSPATLGIAAQRLGPLPLINHFLRRMGLLELLDQHVPTTDGRSVVSHAQALGVLLRSIIVEREPIYRQQETANGFAPGLFGIDAAQAERLGDDRIGRALDRLFDADRGALLTDVVLAVAQRFGVCLNELHNDSTSISFCGQYRGANGRAVRGRSAPAIVFGYSKDMRPDLKQLLFILTVDGDDGVPVQFRCTDGNATDVRTHIETWNTLRALTGRADFLYVADSKLCSYDNMQHIDRFGGRFVTVLPRSRQEDGQFRKWIQTNTPAWELVWDRPNARDANAPRDLWYVFKPELPSAELFNIVWVHSTLLTMHQTHRRQKHLAAAIEQLTDLKRRLAAARARLRGAAQIDLQVAQILERYSVARYLKVRRVVREEHKFKQARRGRPSADMAYRKVTRKRYDIEWITDEHAVAYDKLSDGMYPLITNDRNLSSVQVLTAHKAQPHIEKRFEQLKSVHEIAPVFLKNEARIEALFTLYFLALMVQALIERELRRAMKTTGIDQLPLYPEARACRRPTTEHILRLFSLAERVSVLARGEVVRVFPPELTELQIQVLQLLGVPLTAYRDKN